MGNLIKEKGLTHKEVVEIVRLWYTNGMYKDILQDEDGKDLEEICEDILYNN
tara:strand:- start:48 stop:203 length:156 start_codon:yes stop_codon:yes gene_type:complete